MNEKKYFNEINTIIESIEINSRVRQYQDNSEKLNAYWHIGKLIVDAQGGSRAKYGDNLIKIWGDELSNKYGKFYGISSLKYMRQFYLEFQISQSLIGQLTWTHILTLLPLKNKNERNYYINLVILNNLSVRELKNEIKNKAFDRLKYADKENIKLIETNNYELTIEDMIKDPILIKADINIDNLSEKFLHKYIIQMLENEFLELGKGFTLAGHEYKIIISNRVYKIDLLFFNTELDAYIVVEIKSREIKPQDISQLQFYTNYIDKNLKKAKHNKTIGLLIVKKNNKFVIEYTTNKDIYVTTYKLMA